jgi:hypothetical protein
MEKQNTNLIVFVFIRPELEPTIYHTQGNNAFSHFTFALIESHEISIIMHGKKM